MTIADKIQARDDMLQMLQDGWTAADWSPTGAAAPELRYDGVEKNLPPLSDSSYARAKVTHADGNQSGFARSDGKRMYRAFGIISVQHFGKNDEGQGLDVATYMAIIAERVYQGKSSPNGVWFRRVRSSEIGPTGGWYQINTIIDFEYDEVR